MTFMLRACAYGQKGLAIKDFNHLKCRILSYVIHDYNFERCSTTRNIKFFHNINSFSQDQKTIERTEIYYGPLTKQIKFLKLFSLLTSSSSLMVQPFLYLKAVENDNIGVILGLFACVGFFAITTPLLIHMITKKYVTHLYYNAKEDIYIANTYSLFARTKQFTFTPEDVVVPDVNGMFTNCIIKNIPLFLEQKFFYDSSHYIRIMGYDKPIDFKLHNDFNQTVTIHCKEKNQNDCKEDKNKK
ncbi:PREDICTED: transmembrane protein 70 homolog, mitochondrial [Trachymyrmex septentrionalis]|uniref:transmembrane protein 70 homolog, mitochondrial n=1 Tax=Trachymyrmex septentrionalis TaxID=34720 RepID=UPI00084F0075|nr:PREDICTED: transmembrane protein 70 homolog, mitochondrial [Trachymyrmex septentrionalis]